MVKVKPILIEGHEVVSISVQLPQTKLLIVTTDRGYIMCGALDVGLLNERLQDRNIIAGRALGVQTIEQLLETPLESITITAKNLGIRVGMSGKEAILKMI